MALRSVYATLDTNSSSIDFQNTSDDITLSDCVLEVNRIHHPVYLGCTTLSLLTCLSAFILYIIIRDQIFHVGAESKDETKHWINWNFIISFILRDTSVVTIITLSLVSDRINGLGYWVRVIVVFTIYGVVSNFFWMFIEGLWLYIGVFFAMKRKMFVRTHLKTSVIGWLLPLVIVLVWTAWSLKSQTFGTFDNPPGFVCILGPIYSLLFINLIMMVRVLHRLAGMLTNFNPKWRLAKATLTLTFLLGVQFMIPILILAIGSRIQGINMCVVTVIRFINDAVSALQGLFVAIFYVLTNEEVRRCSRRYVGIPSRSGSTPKVSLVEMRSGGSRRFSKGSSSNKY